MNPDWNSFGNLNDLNNAWADLAQQRPMSAREEFEGPITATIPFIFRVDLSNFAKARAMEGVRSWANWQGRDHPDLTDQIAVMIGDQIAQWPNLAWLEDVWLGKMGHHGAPHD